MVSCVGVKSPSSLYFMTSIISLLYAVISAIGNILLALVILVDPYKQLRKRVNLWLINGAIAGLALGGVVDAYRFYSNYLRAIGENVKQRMPASAVMGKVCHIYLICAQLVYMLTLLASLLDQYLCVTFNTQLSKKISFIALGCVSAIIWGIGHACGLQVFRISYSKMELPISVLTAVVSGVGMVLAYLFVYRRAKQSARETDLTTPVAVAERMSQVNDDPINITLTDRVSQSKEVSVKGSNEARDAIAKVQDAKTLCLAFTSLFTWTAALSFMLVALKNGLYTTCMGYLMMKHLRLLFVMSIVVWGPYIYIFINSEIRRGILALLRMHRAAVAPQPE